LTETKFLGGNGVKKRGKKPWKIENEGNEIPASVGSMGSKEKEGRNGDLLGAVLGVKRKKTRTGKKTLKKNLPPLYRRCTHTPKLQNHGQKPDQNAYMKRKKSSGNETLL